MIVYFQANIEEQVQEAGTGQLGDKTELNILDGYDWFKCYRVKAESPYNDLTK